MQHFSKNNCCILGIRHAVSFKPQGTVEVRKFKKCLKFQFNPNPFLQPSRGGPALREARAVAARRGGPAAGGDRLEPGPRQQQAADAGAKLFAFDSFLRCKGAKLADLEKIFEWHCPAILTKLSENVWRDIISFSIKMIKSSTFYKLLMFFIFFRRKLHRLFAH